MVALVLTRSGFDDLRARLDVAHDTVWVGPDVLTAGEAAELRASGMRLTVFAYPLDPEHLDNNIYTVFEHHPGEVLWVEALWRDNRPPGRTGPAV